MNEQERTDSGQADYEGDEAFHDRPDEPFEEAERTAWLEGDKATMYFMGRDFEQQGRLDIQNKLFVFDRGDNSTGSYFVTVFDDYYLVIGGGIIGEIIKDGEK
jgi:hypothetical protein